MRRARLTTYMSLRELAGLLGMPQTHTSIRRLRRRLKAKERRTKSNILHRLHEGPNAPWFVTLASLREHCPELFDRREEALETIREYVGNLQNDVAELRLRDRALAARIRENAKRIEEVSRMGHGGPPCAMPSTMGESLAVAVRGQAQPVTRSRTTAR